ncbi:MAG: Periplasmic component of the Tol biopolymer transport system [Chthonomonadaceae bacterium]|nr:Periplasmic component of the Tol biopolymer transport system [Chthonomonadaceae bacterium]
MNRAKTNTAALLALLSGLLSLVLPQSVQAQARLSGTTNGLPNGVPLAGPIPGKHYYAGGKNDVIPSWMLRRQIPPSLQNKIGGGRAPGDAAVIRQTELLTKQDPTQQFSGTPAPAQDEHPDFSPDEKYVYFDSDRVSDTNTAENATHTFNLYRMFPDGSGIAQLLPDTINQIEPNIALDGNRVTYVSGGTLSFAAGLDTPTTSGFGLYVYDISNGGAPTALTKNNASNIVFSDVRHPSWSPGGSEIAFAGQVGAGTPYHIYKISVQTGTITPMTTGTSNDTSPAWSPDGRLIAFTTNAKAFNASGPTSATALNANTAQTDIWVVTQSQVALAPRRVTNSSSIVGALVSSNKNPAWSSLNPDPLTNIPTEPGSGAVSENLLAFASNRADDNGDGIANDVKTTFDIYFLHAGIHVGGTPGVFTVTTPESVGNPALKLRTSTPDTAIDPNDPTSRFDPNFVSNEDYPTWPAYQNSYRIVFQSDRGLTAAAPGAELNIWASTIFDINAPALLKYDIPNNEIVHVARDSSPDVSVREVSAGEKVRFRVRAVDYESGVESCYVMIKCPSSSQKSPDAKEHKIFYRDNGRLGILDTAPTQVLDAPFEVDAQAIKPFDPSPTGRFRPPTNQASAIPGIRNGMPNIYAQAVGGLPNGWPSFNQYLAGIDDAFAFSGFSNPPDYIEDNIGLTTKGQDYQNDGSYWMRLWDDGPISKGGHEPEGETAGDGVYTNSWTTPSALPSDWTLDVIVRDRALNPFAPGSTTVGCNWKIYDNVWGFTSAPFSGTNGILYVNDYDSGQRFFQTNFGAGTTFNTGSAYPGSPLSSTYYGWPVESWMTEFDAALFPTRGRQGTTAATVLNFLTPLGVNAYADPLTQDSGTPVTARYDIWRILCRGPVPDSVLNAYKGHVEVQPADVIAGGTGPRSVFVAERCIIWHAPYAGDLFVGPGSIVDNDMQVRLAAFVKTGGRLFLNGQDTAFALSLGQVGATSSFLSSTFKVTFAADNIGNYPPVTGSETYVPRNARGTGPIVWETWYNAFHNYPGPVPPPDDPPGLANFYRGSDPLPGTPRTYGALNQLSVDRIAFTAPSTADVSDFDATWMVDGSPAITWVTDSSASPVISKVVYAAGGWEAINPEFYSPATGLIILKNRRAELIHNVGDYLRTGRIFGNIRSVNGALPLKGVFVRAVSTHTGKTASTALTLSDGSYVLNGLDANAIYSVDAALPGFLTQHAVGNIFHGGYQSRVDIFMTQAQPGSIAGTVTVLATGAPVAGAIVQATDKTTGTSFTATTQTDGTYIIKNVPSNTTTGYLVNLPLAANGGNLDTLGYGGSVPTSYGGPEATAKPAVIVAPSQTVTGINFALTLFPGSISGIVKHHTSVPSDPTVPTAGATVTATATVGTKVYTAITAADGTYSIPSVDPGVYKVTAAAPGYALAGPITATVNSKLNTVVDFVDSALGNFALVPIPPGSLSGLVATSQGVPVPGATVAVVDANGVVLGQVTTGAVQTKTIGGSSYMFNYVVTNVPAGGSVIVGARKDGYNPDPTPTQTVLINTGAETTGINFTIDPLNTFQSGTFSDGTPILSLASAPYEYSGIASSNVATLFGVPAADVSSRAFFFSTWLTDTASYVLFPTPPADTFHLGRGYFIADSNGNTSLALTIKGTPAEQTTSPDPTHQGYNAIDGSFRIALKPGWNLIGEPFPYPVNFLNLKVVGADGTVSDVLSAQSGTNPSLGAALWTYTAGIYQVAYTLDPYRGYWIRAFDNRPGASQNSAAVITLVISPSARQDRSVKDTRGVLLAGNRQTDGWMLNMVASVGDHKSAPTTVGQTRAAVDTYDRYKLEAPPAVSKKDVTMVVEHPEWTAKAGLYSVDVRSANTLTQKWAFTVTSTQANTPVTLNWPNLAQVPRQKDLILTDLDSKQVIDLRGRATYTIAGGATGVVRHFQLDSRPAQRSTLQLSSVAVQVNPRRSAGSGSVNISYNTTADATVQVGITKNGRIIRTVDSSTRAAGVSQVVWDMKDNQGVAVPGDTYNVEVRAQDNQGHTIRQIVPLIIPGR